MDKGATGSKQHDFCQNELLFIFLLGTEPAGVGR